MVNEQNKTFFQSLKGDELIKTILLGICFFIVVGSYTLIKELKDALFVLMVGQKYLPEVKSISYLFMLPLVFFYSFLAGKIKRYSLVVFYAIVYGVGGLVISYFLNHPTIGLINSIASADRIFGWIIYLFMEGYSPFLVSVLWAFFNSISKPEAVKTSYIVMTASSKMGGIISAGLAWLFMAGHLPFALNCSPVDAYIYILRITSCCLLIIPFIIKYMIKRVNPEILEGYGQTKKSIDDKTMNTSSGFDLFFKYPYVLGIFGMIFFWEIINVIFNYMRLTIGLKEAENISQFSAFLYKNAMLTQLTGFIIVSIGTSAAVRYLGQRISLILIPLLIGCAIFTFLFAQTSTMVIITYIFMRAVNYSFAYPIREALYIPTTNDIKFKSKSWIDSFGAKLSKMFGSAYNKVIQFIPIGILQNVQIGFFIAIIGLWVILAYYMGKRWAKAIEKKEIIG
jgi:AAA family ATP:ADP antiporter